MKIFHSLRWRIQLWHGLFLFAVLLGLGIAAYHYEKTSAERRVDEELKKRLSILMNSLPARDDGHPEFGRPPPPGDDFGPPPRGEYHPFRLPPGRSALFGTRFYYQLWRREGEVWGKAENAPGNLPRPIRARRGEISTTDRVRENFREAYTFTPPGECILVGCSTEPERLALQTYGQRLAGIEAAILLIGLGGGWLATSRALKPLDAITGTSNQIADGRLDQRIAIQHPDSELGQLSTSLNETFAKLEASFARQAQFTSDAAHELRTPLSVIISQAQLALKNRREPEEYREMFEASLRAARRMQKLTQSLLELAKLDNGANLFDRQPCDLAMLAAEAISILELPASERGVTFIRDLSTARCSADSDSIMRVILNLLANALEHGPGDSSVTIKTFSAGGGATLSVTDQGPGISAEHLERIFDRFYRADQSRNRRIGGTGLGLAICKTIVNAHGGSVSVHSEPGKGSTFRFSLPEK